MISAYSVFRYLAAFDYNGLWVPSLHVSHCVFFYSETKAYG